MLSQRVRIGARIHLELLPQAISGGFRLDAANSPFRASSQKAPEDGRVATGLSGRLDAPVRRFSVVALDDLIGHIYVCARYTSRSR